MSVDNSFAILLEGVAGGDSLAAACVFRQFYGRLCALARVRLHPLLRGKEDGDGRDKPGHDGGGVIAFSFVVRMEPTGRREAPPDDRLSSNPGSEPRITLRSMRATLGGYVAAQLPWAV